MGSRPICLSKQKLNRMELGDRDIKPLYSKYSTDEGRTHVLSETDYSGLTNAFLNAINDTRNRSPIERAVMQADVWGAYDIIYAARRGPRITFSQRRTTLLFLL